MSTIRIADVFLEDDLTRFKTLKGNRSVEESRVKKIMKSIEDITMIDAPIIVNEKMEVIDGQGRLEACKRLGIPVPYLMIKGLGVRHCRAMNINQTNWTLTDYIKSHADGGSEDYKRLLDFMNDCGFQAMVCCTTH